MTEDSNLKKKMKYFYKLSQEHASILHRYNSDRSMHNLRFDKDKEKREMPCGLMGRPNFLTLN